MLTMPCEFHAHDGHSTRDEREAEWDRLVQMLQRAFPGSEMVDGEFRVDVEMTAA